MPIHFTPLQSSSCISSHLHSSPLIPIRLRRGFRESTEPDHLSCQLVENIFLTSPLKVSPPGILVLATGPPCCNCDHRPRILGCLLSVKKDLEMAGLGPLRPGSRGSPKRQSSATSSKTVFFHWFVIGKWAILTFWRPRPCPPPNQELVTGPS